MKKIAQAAIDEVGSDMKLSDLGESLEMGKRLEAEYKEELEKLSANRVKYTDLTRELNTAKETYNMLTKRLEESRVAGAADAGSVQIIFQHLRICLRGSEKILQTNSIWHFTIHCGARLIP